MSVKRVRARFFAALTVVAVAVGGAVASASTATAAGIADLSVTLTASGTTAQVGGTLTYDVLVTNNGPDAATDVVLKGTRSGAATGSITGTSTAATCTSGATSDCTLASLASGDSFTATYSIEFTQAGRGGFNATVYFNESDPYRADNGRGATYTISPAPLSSDFGVEVTDSPDPVSVGDTVTYEVELSNDGPDAGSAGFVVDFSGAGVTLGSLTPPGAACTTSGSTLECYPVSVADGASTTISVDATTTSVGVVTADAAIAGASNADPAAGNNTDSTTTTVNAASADVGVTLGAVAGPILTSYITYTLTSSNDGPGDVLGATVSIQLPSAVTSASNLPAGCGYTSSTDVVTCVTGAITNGSAASQTFRANLGLLSLGSLSATATRTSSSPDDPNTANDTASTSCSVLTGLIISCS
ncbi:putative repeat protein (TIGR01451 family) [Sediminihabitans luteus]|uniref:Putative repeat protein (TIGR01451 family) n=1 Tax=Sediminihabitans luteus TaxID=1138585 RepID=A0A2M9CZI4_9CELL|nr:DUF11 domain-containing protein [Sediminihabitans luteus]PJJ77356.1 putative repeat protein (TIGR01451 family) [Sediminihabitans luteus]